MWGMYIKRQPEAQGARTGGEGVVQLGRAWGEGGRVRRRRKHASPSSPPRSATYPIAWRSAHQAPGIWELGRHAFDWLETQWLKRGPNTWGDRVTQASSGGLAPYAGVGGSPGLAVGVGQLAGDGSANPIGDDAGNRGYSLGEPMGYRARPGPYPAWTAPPHTLPSFHRRCRAR